ncbi:Pro-Pol poly [Paramuricea clavata]|uniref:Pro-Pol poly n=1 Tax=Paramuricea clavata TaxID=317549 RepID=A0A6S7HAP5_PARCT|nr:Pro-Pol poly [Paramuricea clavata]
MCNNLRNKRKRISGPLTVDELDNANLYWIKSGQSDRFQDEIEALRKGSPIPRDSRIASPDPQLVAGVLRVSGRIEKAEIPWESKHPLILGHGHDVTRLIVIHYHQNLIHAGVKHVFNHVRASVPFRHVRIDYAGPFEIRIGRKRKEKRYICLFRVTHSLDTDSCIMGLRRFKARKGIYVCIMSDNGTNFIGAEIELRKALEDLDQEKISNKLTARGVRKTAEEIEKELNIINIQSSPSHVIIHAGTNNIPIDSTKACSKKLERLVIKTKAKFPNSKVGLSGITFRQDIEQATKIQEVNNKLEEMAAKHDVMFIDNSSIDHTCLNGSNPHLNGKGSAVLASHFITFLRGNSVVQDSWGTLAKFNDKFTV